MDKVMLIPILLWAIPLCFAIGIAIGMMTGDKECGD